MRKIRIALLRGVCQLPAYVAIEEGLFSEAGLDVTASVAPTAWMVPDRLHAREVDFAVIPWTRVAADTETENPLVLVCGSGIEEAALVLRSGVDPDEVRKVAVPQEGGIKDLTAMALLRRLGWQNIQLVRQPSGDGAILSFVGQGADAASMVEPYATMLEVLGMGTVLLRTGDVWKGAPGCSLTTSRGLIESDPELVQKVVDCYVRAARRVVESPEDASIAAEKYIGISARIIEQALEANRPDPRAIRNDDSMNEIMSLMRDLGYVKELPTGFRDLRFLEAAGA
jgi:ABC-type nitrate/sulfonate/bicarbonate transport system substrate-binding protein